MTNPTLIATPFAENGDKNVIPESVGVKPQNATMQAGFPPITQQKISEGGIPPERNDFNGILNLYGQHIVHLNKGLPYEFDQSFADTIGGYPLNASLMLSNGDIVQSTIANNVNNPNLDMSGWVKKGSLIEVESIAELLAIQNPKDGDIANVLSTRFLNYVEFYFEQPNCKSDVVIKRMLDFIDSDVVLLSEDLIFHLVKNLTTKYPQRTNKLLMNPKVISKLL